ncbi:MAG: carboxypeptidase regulatory-like domain-containing protein [Acidobacteriia bacterium]|nr:carboxypeptidase regulatory-like domain-containing protein [Terriglobia bacterium]MYG03218.1 carboxypeptidase regulatory-like domain-containing protein [Terriglobia bacterium]MYK09468.1 carboxypeptidase regulatory-like domain-containing protein [Terriglobia bacterium]
MQSPTTFIAAILACASLPSILTADPIMLVGRIGDVSGKATQGTITVYTSVGGLSSSHHPTSETGGFRIDADSSDRLIVHAQSPGHQPREVLIPATATGVVPITIALRPGQTIHGRVVDASGNGIPGATVQARYHEPDKPIRRVLLDDSSVTDAGGRFVLDNVEIAVPFYVDVLAPGYPPAHSKRLKLEEGATKIESIVLRERGATVVVKVTGESGEILEGVEVDLFADPTNFAQSAGGSWLFPMGFRKQSETSRSGNARFTGVPPGQVAVQIKTGGGGVTGASGVTRVTGVATAASNQEIQISLIVPE